MTDKELQILQHYFPAAAVPMVAEAYSKSHFQLKFTKPRISRLGEFRVPRGKNGICRISLNGDLNPYQMVVTFVHELAHYMVYVNYQNKGVKPHGKEWKQTFAQLLLPYLKSDIFPDDVLDALKQHLQHIKASSTTDKNLVRVMKRYNNHPIDTKTITVENLPEGAVFVLSSGLTLRKGPKHRTRYRCQSLDNGEIYMVSGLVEVTEKGIDRNN